MRVPLTGGAYMARNLIASAQRSINLYPEAMPQAQGEPAPVTHYRTPGLTLLQGCPSPGLARGVYRASTGALYAVVGATVYAISTAWAWTALGTIAYATTPISMSDNGTDIVLVDGSPNGYQIVLATNVFSQITDDAFLGADRVDFIDTFFILNEPGTPTYYTSNSNAVTFDALYFADKTGSADPLATLIALQDEILLVGTLTCEWWIDSGGSTFPFTKIPSAFLEHGCTAKYSIAKQDITAFWLSQDLQGQCIVLMAGSYRAQRISTHAIEAEFQTYATVSDATGFTYQQGGHTFYVLTFPTADKTWVYDTATQAWHEWLWTDNNGVQHRTRVGFAAFANGCNVGLDWQTGALYKIDPSACTDNGQPIVRIRSFPHMMDDAKRVNHSRFIADVAVGEQANGLTSNPPEISLRWSDTRGASWGNPVMRSFGSTGQFYTSVQWLRLGLARDRVYELSTSAPVDIALNGAFLETATAGT